MGIGQRARRFVLASAAIVGSVAGLAHAQGGDAAAGDGKLPPQVLIALERAPFDQWLADPRDAGLKRALGMVPERLAELPRELDDEDLAEPVAVARLILATLAQRGRFAIVFNPSDMSGGAMGYGIIIRSDIADRADGERLATLVRGVIQEAMDGQPLEDVPGQPGIKQGFLPGAGKAQVGVVGDELRILLGTVADADAPFAAIAPPSIEGLTPIVHGNADLEALTPLFSFAQLAMGQEDPGSAQAIGEAGQIGFFGPDAMRATFEIGYVPSALRTRIVVRDADKALAAMGLADARLTRADLALLPVDTAWGFVTAGSMDQIADAIDNAVGPEAILAQPIADLQREIGIEFTNDLLRSLGGVAGVYTSASSGGGGLMSAVGFISFRDREKFDRAHARLVAWSRDSLDREEPEVARYIHLRSWTLEDTQVYTMTFPGLPIPFELSYAMTDRLLIAAPSPQALQSALRQTRSAKSLLDRPDAVEINPDRDHLLSVRFADTATLGRDGFGLVSLGSAALANAVRSPGSDAREPGMILPAFGDLFAKAGPNVQLAHRRDGVLILDGWYDRSILANAAAAAGTFTRFAPAGALSVAAIAAIVDEMDLDPDDVLDLFAQPAGNP